MRRQNKGSSRKLLHKSKTQKKICERKTEIFMFAFSAYEKNLVKTNSFCANVMRVNWFSRNGFGSFWLKSFDFVYAKMPLSVFLRSALPYTSTKKSFVGLKM